jgi:hypothetical protein
MLYGDGAITLAYCDDGKAKFNQDKSTCTATFLHCCSQGGHMTKFLYLKIIIIIIIIIKN